MNDQIFFYLLYPKTEGLELLNEPAGFYDWVWNVCKDNFYSNGYDEIRKVFPDSEKTLVSIQQAFRGYGDFNGVLPHEVIKLEIFFSFEKSKLQTFFFICSNIQAFK